MVATAVAHKRISLDIQGMTCSACVTRLEKAFSRAAGVEKANVNLPLEKATLVVDPTIAPIEELKAIVERTGFGVGMQTRMFFVEGMHEPSHASEVEKSLYNMPGVVSADISFAEERANVTFIAHSVVEATLRESIAKLGFTLHALDEEDSLAQEAERADDRERRILIVACLICVPFLVQMFAQFFGWEEIHMMPAAEVVLATPLQLVLGMRFYRAAYNALRGGSANMDVLVVLGTTAAYFYSWYVMLQLGEAAEGELYFEASALILTFILLGKRLESRAKRATTAAVRELMDLRPRTARIRNSAGAWEEQPLAALELGSVFEVRPGDRVPADGLILAGTTSIDEALLTGESSAIAKAQGDVVFEGSINIDGRVEVETTALGEDGTLQRIVEAIESAQTGKIGVQRLVDRVSAVFVPIVIGLAILVLVAWLVAGQEFEPSLINAVTVLIIACPCALGLATPTAIITGTGAAARAGILYKDIQCIEEAQRITVVAFDKTGTLTTAAPQLAETQLVAATDENDVLRLAMSLQANSTHPIAQAFADLAAARHIDPLTVTNFVNHVGFGIEGEIEGRRYYIGGERLLHQVGVEVEEIDAIEAIYLFDQEKILASFQIVDTLRAEAREAIDEINDLGIRTCMLSGDNEVKSKRIADALQLTEYLAGLTPEQKVLAIEQMSSTEDVVAMVGDGINDAPALARANVGIAMSSGTDISLEVAPITLMRNDLTLVAGAILASRATFRKIKQNLFWAFIYNVVMLPLAGLGVLTPTLAGAAMALSSVSVVCNSLWLRRWKPETSGNESSH